MLTVWRIRRIQHISGMMRRALRANLYHRNHSQIGMESPAVSRDSFRGRRSEAQSLRRKSPTISSARPVRQTGRRDHARRDRSRPRRDNSIPEQQCCRQQRNDLPHFVAHSILGGRTIGGGIIRCGNGQKDANGHTVIFPVRPAFNLDLASVAFNKLLCDEQTDACAHGAASCEEGIEHPWQIRPSRSQHRCPEWSRRCHPGTLLRLPRRWARRHPLA